MQLTQLWKPSVRKDQGQSSAGREQELQEPGWQWEGGQRLSEAGAAGRMGSEPAGQERQ